MKADGSVSHRGLYDWTFLLVGFLLAQIGPLWGD